MAPPGRGAALLASIEAQLASHEPLQKPVPRGGLGGGFRLHQGARKQPPRPTDAHLLDGGWVEPPQPEHRAPLYPGAPSSSERDGVLTLPLEVVMEQRLQHRQQRRLNVQQRHSPPPWWEEEAPTEELVVDHAFPLMPSARSRAGERAGDAGSLIKPPPSFLDEIDAVHASLGKPDASLTVDFLQRVGGGGGSRIDFTALAAETLQQQPPAARRPARHRIGMGANASPRYSGMHVY